MKNVESREHSPRQAADRRALAEINDLIDDGAYEAAGVLAWDVQRDTPGDPAIWLILTRIDFLRERYAAAMYAARMATRLDPSSARAWLWLARTGVIRARWRTEALDAALQATALAPDDPETWTVLALSHLARDARYEAAIAAERAVRVGPTDAAAHRTLGEIAVHAAEWSHAAAALRRALELDPGDQRARARLADALRAQGIDPAEELARYGPVPGRRAAVTGRVRRLARQVTADNLDLSDPGPLRAHPRGLVIGAAACLTAGALVGLAVPGLGVVRGLVGAAALALMWVAIWPLHSVPAAPATARASATGAQEPRARREPAEAPPDATPPPGRRTTAPTPWDAPTTVPAEASGGRAAPARVTRARADRARLGRITRAPAGHGTATSEREPEDDRGDAAGPPAPAVADRTGAGADTVARSSGDEHGETEPDPDDAADQPAAEPDSESPAQHRAGDLPSDPGELVALSAAKLAEFDLEAARAAAERLAEVAPGSLESHRALAAVSLAEQDYARAELHYGKVLDIEPLDQDAHERLAMAKKGRRREEQSQRRRRKG